MATHTYKVDSVTVAPNDDLVTLTGSVDNIPVVVQFWKSAVQPLTPAQRRQFVAPLMLAEAFPPAQQDAGAGINGQFTQ